MTQPILNFYFDYSSPFAYLGATQVEAVAKEHGARVVYRPFLLGGLFKAIGTPIVPLMEMPPAKQRYQHLDMQRWATHYGVELAFPSRFPMVTVNALRMTLQLEQEQRGALVMPLFQAYWAQDRDIGDKAELERIADEAGLNGKALVTGCGDPAVKQALRDATSKAQDAGICGAPSFLVQRDKDDEGMLFWGQDRLMLVAKALTGWRPSCG